MDDRAPRSGGGGGGTAEEKSALEEPPETGAASGLPGAVKWVKKGQGI